MDKATPNVDKEQNDLLAALIARAGPRTQPSAESTARVRAVVHADWQRSLRKDRQRRAAGWLAAAAVAAIGITLGWRLTILPPASAPVVIANVVYSQGDVRLNAKPLSGEVLQTSLHGGDELNTGNNGGARLTLNNAASIRLAAGSSIRWRDAHELQLIAGSIYVDSGPAHASLAIKTRFGAVTHLGTRYQLRVTADALSVGVRDGIVEVTRAQDKARVQSREAVKIDKNGQIIRTNLSPYNDEWVWVNALAPRFEIENRSLTDFLSWAASETGRSLVYEDEATEAAAVSTVLHGASGTLSPDQAIATILPATDFAARYSGERLIISRR